MSVPFASLVLVLAIGLFTATGNLLQENIMNEMMKVYKIAFFINES
jgi:hypothetical protein